MSTMIQIRNVPDDVHRSLKARAAQRGMSLSALLLREITALSRRPDLHDTLARLARRPPVELSEDSAAAVRAERDAP